MSSPSIRSQVAELLGEDVFAEETPGLRRHRPKRLPIAQAMLQCQRLEILAAEDQGEEKAVAVLADGSIVVLPDSCPHDGGLISDGFVEENRIVCARHGWEFDGHTGQCLHKPELSVPCAVFAEGSGPMDS